MLFRKLNSLYKEATGSEPTEVTPLAGAGSNRQYFRLSGPQTLIGVIGESAEENNAFIALSRHFAAKGLPVPKVWAVSDDYRVYLQDDLGDTLLFDAIGSGRATGDFSASERRMLSEAIRTLADVQHRGAEGLDFSLCYPAPEFNRRMVMWDLNYFKYCFLKPAGVEFNESRLEDDFEHLADKLLAHPFHTFMYRDFQSRNVMVDAGGHPHLIDYQGGRKGPAEYDVASFLWQAKANIPAGLREELIGEYLDAASRYGEADREGFRKRLDTFVLFRLLQVLGSYGFRGLHEKKLHFIESIPPALERVAELERQEALEPYPELKVVLKRLISRYLKKGEERRTLLVTVCSFSYKRGVPDDTSGNGGGFVFDCRAMHNPGRYAEFKPLTGQDAPVIEFLEKQGQVQPFLEACRRLVFPSVETYIKRGFTHLMVGFGCTGGQHRSVYCANHLAFEINKRFGIDVELWHREQGQRLTIMSDGSAFIPAPPDTL